MIRQNKGKMLVSSILILLPILAGVLFWDQLPAQMATHWGIDGAADGWRSRAMAVFAMPIFLLVLHWGGMVFTAADPGNRDQSKRVTGMVFWICPVISLLSNGVIYATAFGKTFDMETVTLALIGLMFVVIGNNLPKCRRNYTIGIKVKWAMENDANWNATHRFGGKVWVVGGLLLMACMFLPASVIPYALIVLLTILALLPVVYSYVYYRKQKGNGSSASASVDMPPHMKRARNISLVLVVVILVAVSLLMVTGKVEVRFDNDSFTVEASYWQDLTVDYDAVASVEYREDGVSGSRTNGFGSARLLLGIFTNSEFGTYTRYTYTGKGPAVVISVEERTLVLGGKTIEDTQRIYETLCEKMG